MIKFSITTMAFLSATYCTVARAELPTSFPENSQPVTAESFASDVAGKSFQGARADGVVWRLDFDKNGQLTWFSNGLADIGKWRIEGDKLCDTLMRSGTCNEVRLRGSELYYKRNSNGEVVLLKARE